MAFCLLSFQNHSLVKMLFLLSILQWTQTSGSTHVKNKDNWNRGSSTDSARATIHCTFCNIFLRSWKGPTTTSTGKPTGGGGGGSSIPGTLDDEKIIGGRDAFPGEFPFIVSLQQYETHKCGATILDRKYILTAAHCFGSNKLGLSIVPSGWSVYAGVHNLEKPTGSEQRVNVSKICIHPGFNGVENGCDIAVLEINSELKFTENIRKASVRYSDAGKLDDSVTIAGWGEMVRDNRTERANVLQTAQIRRYDESDCNTFKGPKGSNFCAGTKGGGAGQSDVCAGDSGGPLICTDKDVKYDTCGVVSFGPYCHYMAKDRLSVYTNIAQYSEFIKKVLKGDWNGCFKNGT